jgi:uncharacterized membrane protein YdbT with pleckstrin-like domain
MNTPRQFPFWTAASLMVALIGNLVAAAFVVVPLFQMSSGTGVRLLWENFESFLVSVSTLVLVIILGIIAWRRERYRIAMIPVLFFGLTPFFFSGFAMRLVAAMRGVILEP